MSCLIDYIGFKWCGATAPESGLYINELPGISLKSIDQIANEEQNNFLTVWQTVQKRAQRLLASDVSAAFSKRYRLNSHVEGYNGLVMPETTINQTAAATEWRGLLLALPTISSPLHMLVLKQLSVYLKAAVTTTFKLLDVTTGSANELFSFTCNGLVGWNNIPVQTDLAGVQRLLLVYDATSVESVFTPLPAMTLQQMQVNVQGVVTDDAFSVTTPGINSYGVQVTFNLTCNYLPLLCSNKTPWSNPLLYLLGAELMNERLHSDRLNRYTTLDLAKARELREEFDARYRQELLTAIDAIALTAGDGCVGCNALLQSVEVLP